MAFAVVYDACTLYPAPLRDLLMRLAQSGIVRARWSERILDECFRNIADCLVTGYEEIERAVDLPDADDRHVVAAAIRCGAQTIVTYNLKDFPNGSLAPFGIEAKHPDDFVLDAIGINMQTVMKSVAEQSDALRSQPVSIVQLLDTLRDRGLEQAVARLREEFELKR